GHFYPGGGGEQTMKMGADRKRIALLAALTGAAAYLFYANVFSSPSTGPARPPRSSRPAAVKAPPETSATVQNAAIRTSAAPASGRRTSQDFHPAYRSKVEKDP